MADTHELGGSNVVVDRATPKVSQPLSLVFNIIESIIIDLVDNDKVSSVSSLVQEPIFFFQEDDFKPVGRMPAPQGAYGAYNAYISAATRYAALGAPTLYDHPPHPGPVYGSKSNYKFKLSAIYISCAIIFYPIVLY